MKLTDTALLIVQKDKSLQLKIATALNSSMRSVQRWASENEPDGQLTLHRVVDIIAAHTKLKEGQILETQMAKV